MRSVPHLLVSGHQAEPELELATSLAYVASKRKKVGFIRRRPAEELEFIVKVGWPIRTLSLDEKKFLFDPLGLFKIQLKIEAIEDIREAMQQISGPIFSMDEFKEKLEEALKLIHEPKLAQEVNGFVPPSIVEVFEEIVGHEEIPSIELRARISEEEFLEQISGALSYSSQLKSEIAEISSYINSLTKLKGSWEEKLKEKEEEIRRTYETRIEDAKRYLGQRAEPEVEKLRAEMEKEIEDIRERILEPLNALASLVEKLEEAKSRREIFLNALEWEVLGEGLEVNIPFMIASLIGKEGRRFITIPPSNLSKVGIGGKLKKAFGAIVVPIETRSPIYEEMRSLLEEELSKNVGFSSYILEIGSRADLIQKYNDLFMKGVTRLRDMEVLDEDDSTEVMSMTL